ncbi:outer membrane protein assembly factor BamB [Pseudoteredinibacter isoporae]|uniref:Outer membrane protein assembly factor BamB n=1 Tax=Pseudoteredinibacter isoporae TaxID=570281 RepID=A0A7X0MZG7_9GAMM|nr:outer membrane protein assembly factor BamB [Pseudoteredinibacter isoporae]MBB6523142.1 outer membrane protein assembly factor BamB [Pseudoteredinibacter isoporae]NHO88661.1 outer membrane protein assembly factor BamB [Pseudoteredinibacter isoporae]NIB22648.1 outer membrane protein assembly factor BamB [Pseudoteredinibacter isoporae]
MKKPIALLLLSAVIAGCSSTDEVNLEPMELVDFEPTVELDEVWSKDIGAGQDARFSRLTPVISDGVLFAAGSEGEVVSLNPETGRENWSKDLDKELAGGVGAGPENIFLGSYSGTVYALSRDDGSERWQTKLSSEILSAPQSNGDVVVVQTLDGRLYGLNAENGEQIWRYDNPVPVLTLRGTANPVLFGDKVYAGFASGKAVGLRISDGVQVWEQRVAIPQGKTELERVVDIDATPLLEGSILYASAYQGRIMAINRSSGRPMWATDSSSHKDISVLNGTIFVSGADDRLRALNSANGEQIWENDNMLRRELGAPQAIGSYVAVTDFEGYLHLLDREQGRFVAREKVDGDGVRASMISDGERLYVYGNSGELIAYRIQ